MRKKSNTYFQCGEKGTNMYGFIICDSCRSKLGLFTDETIKKYYKNPKSGRSFEDEMRYRLDFIEKDYIKKKIKLLYILERLEHIKESL